MRAEVKEMQRLGKGGELPSSLEARAGTFLHEAHPLRGLSETEIGAIEKQLFAREHARRGVRLIPVLVALAVLLLAGTVTALASGWRPSVLFLGSPDATPKVAPPLVKVRAKATALAPAAAEATQPASPATSPQTRPQPSSRRLARVEDSASLVSRVGESAPSEGALSVEARSLADALARWRRDGKAEAALALLAAHQRRFPHGGLWVEAQVARAEILLALSRREQALVVLDSLTLTNLPRARELETLRCELRAQAGRCPDARADLIRVLSSTANDELAKRAIHALAACP